MSEEPDTRKTMKILAAIALVYFIGFEIWGLAHALGSHRRSLTLMWWGGIIYLLNFLVLAIGVIREKRPHENLGPKVLAIYGFGVLISIIFIVLSLKR
jgi:hypothetical protein